MLHGKRIALFGTGNLGKYVYAGLASLTYCGTKSEENDFGSNVLKIVEHKDYTTLIKAYKNVQRKYYPEKDVLIKIKDKNNIM